MMIRLWQFNCHSSTYICMYSTGCYGHNSISHPFLTWIHSFIWKSDTNSAFPPPLCFLYAYPPPLSLPGPGKGEKWNLENVWQKQVGEAKTTTARRMQLGIRFWRDNSDPNSAAFIIKILQVFQEIESKVTELWFCNWSNNNVNPFPPLFKCRTVSDCFAVFKSPLEWFCPSQDKARNFRCSRKFSGIQPSFEF